MNINKAIDKSYEKKGLKEIAKAPVSALEGISAAGAKKISEALGFNENIITVREFAESKYVKWAQAIAALADTEE